ncbi:class I SAM-dependent methyltransferase [Clostridium botulinum]|uniref:Class I SAM-dependent methyltransferase n=1 Tax=Clostridium botulinum TaxID=1491 RepID=A0A6M0ST33_CLOBO|nr:class I SAM-dependent methyltransferase [Clostridium botulinum]
MEDKKLYADQWYNSAKYFYGNGSYTLMCKAIKKYKTVLEIGCGTGQSTLSLLENGHKVITIEKNEFCIEKAKTLLKEKGHNVGTIESNILDCDVILLPLELFDNSLLNSISNIPFDVVICWNVGSYFNKSMLQYYIPIMIEHRFGIEYIKSNTESSYAELIQVQACKIAIDHNVPVHFIDRGLEKYTRWNDTYFVALKREFGFSKIRYDNFKTKSMSEGGRLLVTHGVRHDSRDLDLYLNSALLIP